MDRVLVVDDSPTVSEQLRRWLVRAGYDVAVAETGEEALHEVARAMPDLILLDLALPDIQGLEVCSRLKAQEATFRIPVVVLTASEAVEDRIACLERGAEDFLTKPASYPELVARVRSLLRSKHLSDRLHMSFLELDRLGTFAETFAGETIADSDDAAVADAMASHILGPGPELPGHPQLLWAGTVTDGAVAGFTWSWQLGTWTRRPTRSGHAALLAALRPFRKADGQFLSKDPPPAELVALLGLPADPPPDNFVASSSGTRLTLAAGYPWEVGTYEVPLLRALLRQWSVFERLRADALAVENAFFETMQALAVAAEFFDPDTSRHVERVALFTRELAEACGCPSHFVKWASHSSRVHDVGKIALPLQVLLKPTPLSRAETFLIQEHTVKGEQILGQADHLAMARRIARSHQENWDGSGYPDGLEGEAIPLEARMVRLADVYDALRSSRHYKPALTHERAVEIITAGDGKVQPTFFDPTLLELFVARQAVFAAIYEQHAAVV